MGLNPVRLLLRDVNARVGVEHIPRRHKPRRRCGGWSCRPPDMKSSGIEESSTKARLSVRRGFRRTISSPRRNISTWLTSKRNSLGKRTAWLLPDLKIRAVGMTPSSSASIYETYTPRQNSARAGSIGSFLRRPQPLQHGFAEAAAERQLRAVAQQDRVVAVKRRPQRLDAIDIHQRRAMHAQELMMAQA